MHNEYMSADEIRDSELHLAEEAHYCKFKKQSDGGAAQLAKDALDYFYKNLSVRDNALLKMSRSEETTLSAEDRYDCMRLKLYVEGLREVIRKNENWLPKIDPSSDKNKKWTPSDYNKRDF